MSKVEIKSKYQIGSIGRITELHATYYHEYADFGLYFEMKIATEMSEFMNQFDEKRDGLWVALIDNNIIGSIALDGLHADQDGAHLRWFIVDPKHHGQGIGGDLLLNAIDFCKSVKYKKIYLWTFSGLDAARHLYEKHKFELREEQKGDQWGKTVIEQRFELIL
jgi:RimJ/RimL family protein N-acetyltransferase